MVILLTIDSQLVRLKHMKKVKESKITKQNDMTVYDLSILMMKQFERSDRKLQDFSDETKKNFLNVELELAKVHTELNDARNHSEKQDDKIKNVFYIGQEVKRLEVRVGKLEKK